MSGYICPMHPEVRQDEPGDCPKCGMHLVPDDGPQRGMPTEGHASHGQMEHQSSDGRYAPVPEG